MRHLRALSAGPGPVRARAIVALLLRLGLGGLFLYAALSKWAAPRAFAEDVANYRVLPPGLVPFATVALLGFETVLGACLVLGRWRREAAWATAALTGLFCAAVASALARGLKIDCGCFGAGGSPATTMTLLRDLAILAAAGLLCWLTAPSAGVVRLGEKEAPKLPSR